MSWNRLTPQRGRPAVAAVHLELAHPRARSAGLVRAGKSVTARVPVAFSWAAYWKPRRKNRRLPSGENCQRVMSRRISRGGARPIWAVSTMRSRSNRRVRGLGADRPGAGRRARSPPATSDSRGRRTGRMRSMRGQGSADVGRSDPASRSNSAPRRRRSGSRCTARRRCAGGPRTPRPGRWSAPGRRAGPAASPVSVRCRPRRTSRWPSRRRTPACRPRSRGRRGARGRTRDRPVHRLAVSRRQLGLMPSQASVPAVPAVPAAARIARLTFTVHSSVATPSGALR